MMYDIINVGEEVIHQQSEPFTAKKVFEILRGLGDGLYYVRAPHWCYPMAVHDDEVVGLVTDLPVKDTLDLIQDQLDYQQ